MFEGTMIRNLFLRLTEPKGAYEMSEASRRRLSEVSGLPPSQFTPENLRRAVSAKPSSIPSTKPLTYQQAYRQLMRELQS